MKRVLIVDDKEDNLYYLRTLFGAQDWQVDVARHGAEALIKARIVRPDLVVSDLLMPVMDGYTLLRHWKGDVRLREVPFVVYTATYTDPADERLARELGADEFILKPCEPEVFLERVRAVEFPRAGEAPPNGSGEDHLRLYSEVLIRKLEEKTRQLEAANQTLSRELAARQEAERAAVERETLLRTIIATEPAGVVRVDAEGRLVDVNPAGLRLLEEANMAAAGKHALIDYVDEKQHAEVQQLHAGLLKGENRSLDLQLLGRRGTHRLVELHAAPLQPPSGPILGWVGVIRDVTESRRANDALRASEERFRQLADNIDHVFWMSDAATGQTLYVSPAFERIWGRTAASVRRSRESWLEVVHPEDRERVREAVAQAADVDTQIEYRIVRPDGTLRWIRDRSFPVKAPHASARRVVGVAEDITERKELAAKVQRSQRMELIGTLASGVAHDVNNILTPMLMGASLLKAGSTRAEDRQVVEMIEASAQRGAAIIRQLLAFSRGSESSTRPVQVRHLLREVGRMIKETFPRHLEIEQEADPDLWAVLGDATQLHQVILNLCVNARDAMPHGGHLSLRAHNAQLRRSHPELDLGASPGPYVVISVVDTGHGVAPAIADRIFDPFFTTKSPGLGTGLGLSTVLGIVRSHGGFVKMESSLGRGAAFRVYLPAQPEGAQPEDPATPGAPGGQGELILVVDDEEPICTSLRLLLERSGYRAICAPNGAEALARFHERREEVALALIDAVMPVMNGVELARKLRAERPGLPIVLSSGLDFRELMRAEVDLRDVPVLDKPYEHRQLLSLLHQQLKTPGTPPGPAGPVTGGR